MSDSAPPTPKELGFWMCTALVVGNTIGMGIFLLPASLAPYGFNALVGWLITTVGCIFLARMFARLARDFPQADSPFSYIQQTLGPIPAFLAVWTYWFSIWITNATLAIGVIGYLVQVLPLAQRLPPAGLALILIWLFVVVNLMGARTGGRVQVAGTVLKLVPMAMVMLLGAWVLLHDPAAYSRQLPTTPLSMSASLSASTLALYAMLGIESATIPAGRVRDPERTIPRATLLGTLITAAIYILVSLVLLLLIPQQQLAQSSAPFVDLLSRFMGSGTGRWIGLFVTISVMGALNGWTLLIGELTASMAAHGVMPAALQKLNRRGAPARALLLSGVLASLIVLMSYSHSLVNVFTFLTQVVTAANLPLYLLCALALVAMARSGGFAEPAQLRWLGWLATCYSLFSFAGIGWSSLGLALGLAVSGLPLYWWMRRVRPSGG
ncbi:MAG TPA: amino acid permease [Steroidobacteraceae bacterium]|nr:amino acid permease [Steroidobacteraceae bacterium]